MRELSRGEKTSTVRWNETIRPGPAVFDFGKSCSVRPLAGHVLSVLPFRLPELTAQNAHQPAGTDMSEFVRQLRDNYYPDLPDDATLDVVDFAVDAVKSTLGLGLTGGDAVV